jgi:hypothetical protein
MSNIPEINEAPEAEAPNVTAAPKPPRGTTVYLKLPDEVRGKVLLREGSGPTKTVELVGDTFEELQADAEGELDLAGVDLRTVGVYTYFAEKPYLAHR